MTIENWTNNGGLWNVGADWSPDGIPTAADDTTITGPSTSPNGSYPFGPLEGQTLTGPGSAASMTFIGATTLSGGFSTGILNVGTLAKAGGLTVGPGAALHAAAANLQLGPLSVYGTGATLTVDGALNFDALKKDTSSVVSNDFIVDLGGIARVGSITSIPVPGYSLGEIAVGNGALAIGNAAPIMGSIVIAAGQVVSGLSLIAAQRIDNSGTILATAGTDLIIESGVSGSGQTQIGAGAVLEIDGRGVSTQGVTFTGAGGELLVSLDHGEVGLSPSGLLSEQGIISGFTTGDQIVYSGTSTGVSYVATTGNLGTLTISNGTTIIGTLTLAGDFSGYSFEVASSLSTAYNSITLVRNSAPAPEAKSWTNHSDPWNVAADWSPTGVPAATDDVIITGPSVGPTDPFPFGPGLGETLTGPGSAASMTFIGATTLSGIFSTGTLNVGSLATAGAVTMSAGAVLHAASANLQFGPLAVYGTGATLTVDGAVTFGGVRTDTSSFVDNDFTVDSGAIAQVGSVETIAVSGYSTGRIIVSGTGSLIIGNATGITGGIAIAAGQVVSGPSFISAPQIDNSGTILALANASVSIDGAVSGSGQMEIGAGAFLGLAGGGVSSQGVTFVGTGGELLVSLDTGSVTHLPSGALSEQGIISGFTTGDVLAYSGTYMTVSYAATTGSLGTLTISNGTTKVGTLTLAGDYSGYTFQVTPMPTGPFNQITLMKNSVTVPVKNPPAVPFDFNGDGRSDLLLQHDNGTMVIETTSGLGVSGAVVVGDAGPAWHVVGVADFNGDGKPDILMQNTNGAVVDYLMAGTTIAAGAFLGDAGPSWHVRGTGDFNGDGRADVLLQNDNGAMVVWDTNGSAVTGTAYIGNPGAGWTIEGVADFNGDGHSDVLVQNTDGTLVVYTMNGSTITAGASLGNPGAGWAVAGTGDYNGDGKADVLLHNDNGTDVIWETNGSSVIGTALVGNPGAGWTGAVAGMDFNGDGAADIMVQNTNGTVVGYTLNNSAAITAGGLLATPGAGWHAIGNNPVQFIDGSGASLIATPGVDQFDFSSVSTGLHQINGFDPAQDSIVLSQATFATVAAAQAAEQSAVGGTSIALGGGATLFIAGVAPGQLTAADFVLR